MAECTSIKDLLGQVGDYIERMQGHQREASAKHEQLRADYQTSVIWRKWRLDQIEFQAIQANRLVKTQGSWLVAVWAMIFVLFFSGGYAVVQVKRERQELEQRIVELEKAKPSVPTTVPQSTE